jgi:hypothetical protein
MDGGGGGATDDFEKLPVEERLTHKVPFSHCLLHVTAFSILSRSW